MVATEAWFEFHRVGTENPSLGTSDRRDEGAGGRVVVAAVSLELIMVESFQTNKQARRVARS